MDLEAGNLGACIFILWVLCVGIWLITEKNREPNKTHCVIFSNVCRSVHMYVVFTHQLDNIPIQCNRITHILMAVKMKVIHCSILNHILFYRFS